MNRHTFGIDGGDTSRCHYGERLGALLLEATQKSGFARTSFARKKDAAVGMLYVF